MRETLSREKTYTCGWCKKTGISKNSNGDLATHYKPGTHSTECRGQETYNLAGRSK